MLERTIKTIFLLLAFLAGNPGYTAPASDKDVDPYESINRTIFDFNRTADKYLLKPVAVGYNTLLPPFARIGINHIFLSIGEVPSTANSLLQAKLTNALKSVSRLVINGTLGFFFIFDVAGELGLTADREDFGQTLATWGVPAGPYIVIPFLGSRTVRSATGNIVDIWFDPIFVDNTATRNSLFGLRTIDTRAGLIDAEELIIGDPYLFIRSVYLQNRDVKIHDGMVEDTFSSETYEEDWLED